MRFEQTDIPVLEALAPFAVAGYLRAQGWVDTGPWGQFGRNYEKTIDAETKVHVTVPVTATIKDYAEQMASLIERVAEVESKSIGRLLADLSMAPYDVVRVKAKRSDAFGSVRLSDGEELFECARDVLVAAAVHTVTDRVEVNRRGPLPTQARDYLDKVRLGQTERGSFVLTILSPFSYDVDNVHPDMFADAFGRRVVRKLGNALNGVDAALRAAVSEGPEAFRRVTEVGVSAKLCRALGQLAETGYGTQLSVTWSPQKPLENAVFLDVQRESASMLQEAAGILAVSAPPELITIQGPVLAVSEQSPDAFDGEVRIYATVDGTLRVIRTKFGGFERDIVFAAFRDKKSLAISITGELKRDGRPWFLDQPRDFQVIELGDE